MKTFPVTDKLNEKEWGISKNMKTQTNPKLLPKARTYLKWRCVGHSDVGRLKEHKETDKPKITAKS